MRPYIAAVLTAIIAGLIVFGALFFRPVLMITVAPATATVSFGDQTRQGGGTFVVWPGAHQLTIKEDGFVPLQRTERLSIGQRVRFTVNLKPIPKPTTVADEPVLLVGNSTDGGSVIYVGNDGKTLFARDDKEQRPLTPNSFQRPAEFLMSPTQDVALLKNLNGDYFLHDFKRYNLVEQQQFFFGRNISDIDWLYPEADKLVYTYAPPSGEQTVIVANRTNKELDRIFNLKEAGIASPTIAISPDGKIAVLAARPSREFERANLYLLDLFTKRARQLTTDGNKTDARFSPSGKYIIYTRFDRDPDGINNNMLSVMDADGRNRKDFNIRANLKQASFLDDATIVVAQSGKTASKLIRLNLATGAIAEYYHTFPGQFHISQLVVAPDKKSVWVTASSNPKEIYGSLYIIKLVTSEYE